jgi:hypothetical protein
MTFLELLVWGTAHAGDAEATLSVFLPLIRLIWLVGAMRWRGLAEERPVL